MSYLHDTYRLLAVIPWLILHIHSPVNAQMPDSTLVGRCSPATAEAFLDINDVRAKILNNGSLFWNGGPNVYEVPKGSGLSPMFTASLWLGGKVEGDIRLAGARYGSYEFWPGPILEDGSNPENCGRFDVIHGLYYDSDLTWADTRISDSVRDWPAHLGAPFSESNGVPGYQPESGDRPVMYGDQMQWWVMNDRGNVHESIETPPLNIEVRGAAFAYDLPGVFRHTTFYRYEITNRNPSSIEDFFFGVFLDPDVGAAFDDYIGTDTTLGMIYAYNADNNDDGNYGVAPPAVGLTLVSSSHEPNADYERFSPQTLPGFNHTMNYVRCEFICWGVGERAYRVLQARFPDGQKMTLGGDGRDYSMTPIDYYMPGDPVAGEYWSEIDADGEGTSISPADRSMWSSFGPIDLAPGETFTTVMAIVWARGTSNLDSVRKLKVNAGVLRANADLFTAPRTSAQDHDWRSPTPPVTPAEPDYPLGAVIYPNPAFDVATIRLSLSQPMNVHISVFDGLGRRMSDVVDADLGAGNHTRTVETAGWPPGVYLVRMQLDLISETRRLVVL